MSSYGAEIRLPANMDNRTEYAKRHLKHLIAKDLVEDLDVCFEYNYDKYSDQYIYRAKLSLEPPKGE